MMLIYLFIYLFYNKMMFIITPLWWLRFRKWYSSLTNIEDKKKMVDIYNNIQLKTQAHSWG